MKEKKMGGRSVQGEGLTAPAALALESFRSGVFSQQRGVPLGPKLKEITPGEARQRRWLLSSDKEVFYFSDRDIDVQSVLSTLSTIGFSTNTLHSLEFVTSNLFPVLKHTQFWVLQLHTASISILSLVSLFPVYLWFKQSPFILIASLETVVFLIP